MSNGYRWWESEAFRSRAVLCLIAIGAIAKMVGEFCREAAVLLVVFVPLELWRPIPGSPLQGNWWGLATATVSLLGIGMFLEGVALLAHRFKRDLEGNHGSERLS